MFFVRYSLGPYIVNKNLSFGAEIVYLIMSFTPGPWIKVGKEIRSINGKRIAHVYHMRDRNSIAALPAIATVLRMTRDALRVEEESRILSKELKLSKRLIVSVMQWANGKEPDRIFLETMKAVAKEYNMSGLWQEKIEPTKIVLEYEPDDDSPFRPLEVFTRRESEKANRPEKTPTKPIPLTDTITEFIYENADKAWTAKHIAQRLGLGNDLRPIYMALQCLIGRGLVIRTGRGRFATGMPEAKLPRPQS